MAYSSYALPVLDVTRDIQRNFEALSRTLTAVPPDRVAAIRQPSRELLGLRMAINACSRSSALSRTADPMPHSLPNIRRRWASPPRDVGGGLTVSVTRGPAPAERQPTFP